MTTWVTAIAVVAALACGAAWWLRRTFLITTVTGRSMTPTYADGDRLLVRRVPLATIRRGDVVVLVDPDLPADPARSAPGRRRPAGELIIKRAAAVPGDPLPAGIPVPDQVVPVGRLVVLGDNPNASHDSRNAGYFAADDLVGVVVRPMNSQDRP